MTDRGVLQSKSMSNLVGGHHEQVVSFVSIQRPPLSHVKVGFTPTRQEGVSQSPSWRSKKRENNNKKNMMCTAGDQTSLHDAYIYI